MQEQIEHVIQQVTFEVFQTMASKDPEIVTGGKWNTEISAVVGLGGERQALVALHSPRASARFIAASILGDLAIEMSDSEVRDAAGEVANIIAGNINLWLREQGIVCSLTVPTVITGREFEMDVSRRGKRTSVDFAADGHPYRVELILGEG